MTHLYIDDFPMKTSIYSGFSMAMLNDQMVYLWMYLPSARNPPHYQHGTSSFFINDQDVKRGSKGHELTVKPMSQTPCCWRPFDFWWSGGWFWDVLGGFGSTTFPQNPRKVVASRWAQAPKKCWAAVVTAGTTEMRKTALITGITGQDGSYLAEFLLDKGCLEPR